MKAISRQTLIRHILTGSLIFYIFSGVSSLLNYAFYPVIARFVSTSEYGEIQFLVSMFTQFSVGFVVLNILAIIISAKITEPARQKVAIHSLNVISSSVILLIVAIGSGLLYGNMENLGLTSASALLALAFSLFINVPFTIAIGQLQGNDKFISSGVISMIATLLKLIFSTVFVLIGFGVTGAILGIALGMLTTLVITMIINSKSSNSSALSFRAVNIRELTFIREQALMAMLAVTAVTLLSSADGIVSRIILSSEEAGKYAAIATISKMILAATSPLMWLALPPAVKRDRVQIIKFTLLTVFVSFILGVIFSIFGGFLTNSLLGIDAGAYTNLIPLSSLAMGVCSVAFVLISISICLSHLYHAAITTIISIGLFFLTFYSLTEQTGPLYATLYAQIAAGICFIIGGGLALGSRYFK
jgi:O-antigen/teichoic acid export membrane protein